MVQRVQNDQTLQCFAGCNQNTQNGIQFWLYTIHDTVVCQQQRISIQYSNWYSTVQYARTCAMLYSSFRNYSKHVGTTSRTVLSMIVLCSTIGDSVLLRGYSSAMCLLNVCCVMEGDMSKFDTAIIVLYYRFFIMLFQSFHAFFNNSICFFPGLGCLT